MKRIYYCTVIAIGIVFLGSCSSTQKKQNETATRTDKVQLMAEQVIDSAAIDTGSVTIIEETGDSIPLLSYQRTSCYGRCPVYLFQLFPSGDCTLDAKQFYKVEGKHSAKLTVQQLDTISVQLKSINFFSLKDEYNDPKIADIPALIIKVHENGKTKQVNSIYRAPRKLIEFQMQVQQLIDALNWEKK